MRDILPGDIYLGELLPSSDGLGPPDVDNAPTIVRVYQRPNKKDVMEVSCANSLAHLPVLRCPLAILYRCRETDKSKVCLRHLRV